MRMVLERQATQGGPRSHSIRAIAPQVDVVATMGWVHWWNTSRLHQALGYRTPAEVEATYTHDRDVAPIAS